ncbi:MAG: hypothetical protein UY07_C0001G0012 [Parcubacteria group bacterium GW2011_GWA1_47_8]|nr:MAG: hypothetical protein UY07_C0001G0012 [Parcubacteria group bacterium GW2011_GWA1_47_8]KKW07225.1 MAG: hypothetical protein UY42_C0016G0012 [Parcubacteria group bacterium GW2011_GWA2_49_16]
MDGIIRKPKNEVLGQDNSAKRPPLILESSLKQGTPVKGLERIEQNPFFDRINMKPRGEPQAVKTTSPKQSRSYGLWWALAVTVLLSAGFAVATYFSSATIELVPLTKSANLDHEFTASLVPLSGDLGFQLVSLTEETSKDIPATVSKDIKQKASGKVAIFNAYSTKEQRLVKNTRLESSDHKIFRIDESVVVPGAKIVGGKVVTPGSVEVLAYADAAGEEYNIGLADFTIPGLKGDPRYTKFTARSKPDSPIKGGFSGSVKVPTDEAVAGAEKDLREELKKNVVEKARGQIPETAVFFPGSMVLKFEEIPLSLSMSSGDTAHLRMRAIASVFFFDKEILTKKIAQVALPEFKDNMLTLSNIATLVFTFGTSVDTVVLTDLKNIRFTLVGTPLFVGQIDTQKIASDLAGKDKATAGKIIAADSNVKSANTVIRPLWKTTFPADPTKISVKIVAE